MGLSKKVAAGAIGILLLAQTSVVVPAGFALAQCPPGGCGGGASGAASGGGGLAGLLGGGGGGMMQILGALLPLLLQLFQGGAGGSTPQQGNVDEQLPYYGTVGPQGTGSPYGNTYYDPYAYGQSGNTSNVYNPYASPTPTPQATLCDNTLFLAGSGADLTLRPEETDLVTGDCVNLINGTGANQTVRVYKGENVTPASEQAVAKEGTFIFRFASPGDFAFCVKQGSAEDYCGAAVFVGN